LASQTEKSKKSKLRRKERNKHYSQTTANNKPQQPYERLPRVVLMTRTEHWKAEHKGMVSSMSGESNCLSRTVNQGRCRWFMSALLATWEA
jgi:hypothetical protein